MAMCVSVRPRCLPIEFCPLLIVGFLLVGDLDHDKYVRAAPAISLFANPLASISAPTFADRLGPGWGRYVPGEICRDVQPLNLGRQLAIVVHEERTSVGGPSDEPFTIDVTGQWPRFPSLSWVEITFVVGTFCSDVLAVWRRSKNVELMPSGEIGRGLPPETSCTKSRAPCPGWLPEKTILLPLLFRLPLLAIQRAADVA